MAPHLPLLVLSSGATVGPPSPRAPSLRELILAAPRCPGLEDWPQLEPRKALGTTPQPLNIPALASHPQSARWGRAGWDLLRPESNLLSFYALKYLQGIFHFASWPEV